MTESIDNTAQMPLRDNAETECSNTNGNISLDKDQEIENLRLHLDRANARLVLVSEGMRLLASQIRHADLLAAHPTSNKQTQADDHSTVATDCDTVLSEDETSSHVTHHHRKPTRGWNSFPVDIRLCEITEDLSPAQTADLLALQNAAYMLQEHARLASTEAAVAVQDTVAAQSLLQEWRGRALRAESACTSLHSENGRLREKNKKLRAERRILVKEVRKLHEESQQPLDSTSHVFESYLIEAMNMHEQTLKKKSKQAVDDLSTYSVTSDEDVAITLKTDKPIHVESESALPKTADQSGNTRKHLHIPVSPAATVNHVMGAVSTPTSQMVHGVGNGGSLHKLSSIGRAVRKQAQRSFAKSSEGTARFQRRISPPERIEVYPGDCVSPVMSYDSNDGVWSVDESHHSSKSTLSATDTTSSVDKECSGCVSIGN